MKSARIAPHLARMITDLDPTIRPGVVQALVNSRRLQGNWHDDRDGDCFWVIAAMHTGAMPLGQFLRQPVANAAQIFGVSDSRVMAVYQEWDNLPPQRLDQFIASLREEHFGQPEQSPLMARATDAVRELVGV